MLSGLARLILEPEVPLSHVHFGAFAGIAAAPLAGGVGTMILNMPALESIVDRLHAPEIPPAAPTTTERAHAAWHSAAVATDASAAIRSARAGSAAAAQQWAES